MQANTKVMFMLLIAATLKLILYPLETQHQDLIFIFMIAYSVIYLGILLYYPKHKNKLVFTVVLIILLITNPLSMHFIKFIIPHYLLIVFAYVIYGLALIGCDKCTKKDEAASF